MAQLASELRACLVPTTPSIRTQLPPFKKTEKQTLQASRW